MSIAEIAIMRAKCLELAEELDRRATSIAENEDHAISKQAQLTYDSTLMRRAAAIFEREAN